MKNNKLISYAFLAAVVFSPAVFAESKVDTSNKEITKEVVAESKTVSPLETEVIAIGKMDLTPKEVTKEEVVSAIEDYQEGAIELAQPRRSALFLHILDSVVKNSTMAKLDNALPNYTTQLSELFTSDGTLL